ncbi:MAG: type VI secretion system tip protein VgrG, partial [Bacteroidales bacterium]|nr:type VI secretion system tip protein VgrG [Bacteroidales bacterium]
LLHHGGKVSDSELQAWADAKMLRTRMSRVRGRVKFQGIVDAKPGVIIEIAGAGDKLNGNHYVSAVRHSIANGNWTSDVQFGIHPDFFTQKHHVHSPRAAGLIGAVSGLQIGLVTQLQDDPDGEERILVRLPIINADDEGIWARVASLDAGNERGFYFRPEIGDEVIVGFVNDDPRDAIVLGMLHSSGMPSGFEASDDNHEKGYISRSGIKLVFDDEKKSCILETPGGKIVTIDDDAGLLRFEDENGNFMEMTSDGITLESAADLNITASGDINIEGTNISNTAQANFAADGSAGIELTSSATAKLQGSLVQIN